MYEYLEAAIWGKHIFYNIENQFEGKKLGDITEADLIETLQELAYQSVQIVNIHEGWLTERLVKWGSS